MEDEIIRRRLKKDTRIDDILDEESYEIEKESIISLEDNMRGVSHNREQIMEHIKQQHNTNGIGVISIRFSLQDDMHKRSWLSNQVMHEIESMPCTESIIGIDQQSKSEYKSTFVCYFSVNRHWFEE